MSIHTGILSFLEILVNQPYLLIGSALTYACWYVVSIFVVGTTKGDNPLAKDYRNVPKPFVRQAKDRDAVLKQRFKANLVPENPDVVIVGSGIGGLTAGVLLSRAGLKVLVLEQHDQAGGCCHTFVEKGFEFDTGIHYVGSIEDGTPERVLLDQMTCAQLRWTALDDAFDILAVGEPAQAKLFKMKSGEHRYVQNLVDMFPQEKGAILRYMELIKDAGSSFMGLVMLKVLPRALVRFLVATGLYRIVFKCYRKGYTERTLQSVLDSLTSNKELQLVLSYICGDYGVLPREVPFLLHAMLVKHYANGAFYPTGGSTEIAFHLIQSIQDAGGSVLVQAPVTKILCDKNGRAIGVRVGKNEVEIHARFIISDAGVVNTFKTMLPENVAKASYIYPLIERVGQSFSFISTFIGVEGSAEDLRLPAGNIWLYNTDDINKTMSEFLELSADGIEDAKIPFSFISFPSAKEPEWGLKCPGKTSVLAITPAKWSWFEEWKDDKVRHRGERYDGVKDAIGRQMWRQCVDLFPQLDGKKVYMEVGTPVSNQHYLAEPKGEMFGLDQKLSRFTADVASKLRPDTDVPGLYLTGKDTLTCGFVPSMMMGLICASSVLGRNLYNDLLKISKQVKKTDSLTHMAYPKKQE